MKSKKLLSILLIFTMLSTIMTALPVLAEGETVYTSANGWTLNGSEEQQDGSLAIKAGGSTPTVFTPTLTTGKKYSITYEVTGLETGSNEWHYPFRMKVSAGGTDVDGALQYRMAGRWEAGSNTTYGTNGTMEVIFDTVTGEWETYALGKLAYSGTFADPSDFALKFYRWSSDCQAYISNVTVTDITPSIYNSANGWSKGTDAIEQGTSLVLGKQDSVFTPALTSGNQYEITFDIDVPDTIVGGSWGKPVQISLYAGGTAQANVMSYYLSGAWMDSSKATTYGNTGDGTMKVTVNTVTGAWSIDAPGTGTLLTGTFTAPVTGFGIGLHCEKYVDPATYPVSISNMTVSGEVAVTPEPTIEPVIYTAANGWTLGGAGECADGSLKIAKGSANAALFTPTLERGKVYEISFDVTGLTTVSGSWKKPITVTLSAGGQTESNVLTYRMAGAWRDATTDQSYALGTNGTNKIVIDTATGEWETYALGNRATYSGFTSNANNLTKTYRAFSDVSDFTIEFYAYDTSSDFDTPYISNVTVTEIEPTGDTAVETPVLLSYEILSGETQVDTPDGLSAFQVGLHFKPNGYLRCNLAAFAVVYDATGRAVRIGMAQTTVGGIDTDVTIPVTLSAPYSDAANTLKVLVWDGLLTMRPLIQAIDPIAGVTLTPVADVVDLHNDFMRAYLEDDYTNFSTYAWGSFDKDDPKPVSFRWASKEGMDSYTLEIGEMADLSDAHYVWTEEPTADVYNLKLGTKYYYRVTATDGSKSAVSDIGSFTTGSNAPRCIQANGLSNARDVGGWSTADGKTVKQGMIYRSYCFDYVKSSDGTTVTLLKPDGIDTLVNELGIKTEIDLRSESTKTSSILGAGVNYYRFGMNYSGDYLSSNQTAIKNVFDTLANPENYPIIWHCQAGADRTGAITYLLNGLLGVSKEDLLRDYLLTNFAVNDYSSRELSAIENRYVKTLDEYEGETLSDKIYNYLHNEIGVSTENLDFIKTHLVED